MLIRNAANPLISPKDVTPSQPGFKVIGTFNVGACAYGDEIILLVRVAEQPISDDEDVLLYPHYVDGELVIERIRRDDPNWQTSDPRTATNKMDGTVYLSSVSHIRLARSTDGVHFTVDQDPWLLPETPFEGYGVEDPRITEIEGRYYVNYTAVSAYGIATGLVSTTDFKTIKRHGIIFPPANRDVTIFPQRINGQYVCYHRPMPVFGGLHMWMATSPDLERWGDHQIVVQANKEGWTNGRIGGGAPPVLTSAGWLSIYHAADRQDRYCLGAFITDKDDPGRVIAMPEDPIFIPEAPYEAEGFFGKVVFTCGAVLRGGQLYIYYGAADEHTALATVNVEEFVSELMA